MTCATATLPQVTLLEVLVRAVGDYGRAIAGKIALAIGTAAVACAAAGLITMAAAGVVSRVASVRGPIGLVTVARANPHPYWGGGLAKGSGPVRALASPALAPMPDDPPQQTAPTSAESVAMPLLLTNDIDLANGVPSETENLFDHANYSRPVAPGFSADGTLQFASLTEELPAALLRAPARGDLAQHVPIFLPEPDSRTAVYDIKAQTVYLPSGDKLEAHSGLGKRRDDPRYVAEKGRGPTPPNVYRLTMRERPFHGVRALRLNPVPGSTMYGRDGILAHTYMRGGIGQSRGCVALKNYPAFLRAFLDGEIDRIVVVPELGTKVSAAALAYPSSSDE